MAEQTKVEAVEEASDTQTNRFETRTAADKRITQQASQETLMKIVFDKMKRNDERKHPQKVRSKKRRRAAARQARLSRKKNR